MNGPPQGVMKSLSTPAQLCVFTRKGSRVLGVWKETWKSRHRTAEQEERLWGLSTGLVSAAPAAPPALFPGRRLPSSRWAVRCGALAGHDTSWAPCSILIKCYFYFSLRKPRLLVRCLNTSMKCERRLVLGNNRQGIWVWGCDFQGNSHPPQDHQACSSLSGCRLEEGCYPGRTGWLNTRTLELKTGLRRIHFSPEVTSVSRGQGRPC